MDFKKRPNTHFEAVDKLSKEAAADEVNALREGIRYHDYRYYIKNQPEISDRVYDQLFHRLEELEEAFPELKSAASPTVRVGAKPVDKLKKVRHSAPMLSLQAVSEQREVEAFHRHIRQHANGSKLSFVLWLSSSPWTSAGSR